MDSILLVIDLLFIVYFWFIFWFINFFCFIVFIVFVLFYAFLFWRLFIPIFKFIFLPLWFLPSIFIGLRFFSPDRNLPMLPSIFKFIFSQVFCLQLSFWVGEWIVVLPSHFFSSIKLSGLLFSDNGSGFRFFDDAGAAY